MIYKLTNIFCNTSLKITFHTNNTIHNILYNWAHNTNICAHSGIYQLKCHTFNLLYMGQTSMFRNKIQRTHPYPIESSVTWLHSAQNSKRMNTFENYYFQFFHQNDMIMKEQNREINSPIWINLWYTVPQCSHITPYHQPHSQTLHFPCSTSVPSSTTHRQPITYILVSTSPTTISLLSAFHYSVYSDTDLCLPILLLLEV
jgi:hypothetical protein